MSHRNDHERSDMDPRYILFFGVGLAILCAIVIAGVWGLYGRFERQDEARSRPAPVGEITPVPEPSTWALMLIGPAFIGFVAQRRRRR